MNVIFKRMLKRLGVEQTHPVTIQRDVRVPMYDGAELMTDLYLGSAQTPAPAILIRSPYGRGVLLASVSAYPLAARGYNVVVQSCRGTFGSAGRFDPHHDEQRDGLATIEWIKQQPWCDGTIATYGMSYMGYVQWAVAAAAGPEVKAMAMQATLSDFSKMTYAGDSFALQNALTWTHLVTMMKRRFPMLRLIWSRLRGGAIRAARWRMLPLSSMDQRIVGERVHFWQDWLEHSSSTDPWWAPMSFRESIKDVKRPISMVAGWLDIFLPWQMQDFAALRAAGCDARITVGPWGHTDPGLGRTAIQDALDWFERHLRGKPGDAALPVKLYVIGANEWREFDHWPPRECSTERWYLHPGRRLTDRLAPESQPDHYRYDPADPTPSIGGPSLENAPFAVDNRSLESRADVLTYTSDPLVHDREIIGEIHAELYVTSNAASADFFVRLCDVQPNGLSTNICDGLQRIDIERAGVVQYVRVALWPTAYRINRGHRLRVQISSGAFPRWARNLGDREPIGKAARLRVATQAIHHSPRYPSAIELPFLRATADSVVG